MLIDVCIVSKEQPKFSFLENSEWKLNAVFNRGTQIWPSTEAQSFNQPELTDVFQCRFSKADAASLTQTDSMELLSELTKANQKWVQVHLFEE